MNFNNIGSYLWLALIIDGKYFLKKKTAYSLVYAYVLGLCGRTALCLLYCKTNIHNASGPKIEQPMC